MTKPAARNLLATEGTQSEDGKQQAAAIGRTLADEISRRGVNLPKNEWLNLTVRLKIDGLNTVSFSDISLAPD